MSWIPFSIWREGDGPLCVAFACEIPSGSNLHLIFLRQVFCDLDRAASSFFPRDGRGVFFLRKSISVYLSGLKAAVGIVVSITLDAIMISSVGIEESFAGKVASLIEQRWHAVGLAV